MARWKHDEFSAKLKAAADAYDRDRVEELCSELITHLKSRVKDYPAESAKDDLQTLRNKRLFALMARVGDAYIRSGLLNPQIRRQYAQALLDQGNVTAGLAILEPIVAEPGVSKRELAEARGLIGRAYKQMYVDAGSTRPPRNREALKNGIKAYLDVYNSDKERFLWQGVNATTLLKRAERDGVEIDDFEDPDVLAEEILGQVRDKERAGEATMWDLATAAEACVALEEWQEAGQWLKPYVEHRRADAFELASTCRQFERVIQLDLEEGEERYLIDLLRAQLLKREGGGVHASAADLRQRASDSKAAIKGLEKVLGDTRYMPHRWMMTCFQRAQGVGRVWRGARGVGTGFLLPGSAISEKWQDHQVFLTNSHVISEKPVVHGTLRPPQARITFDALHGEGIDAPRYRAEWLWESPIGELDTTILKLDKPVEGLEEVSVSTDLPAVEDKSRVYVIGHPKGGELSYSMQDNQLLAHNETRIHYRSPTDPGSSGSPLFDDSWDYIGIHHAGGNQMPRLDDPDETYPANEGIPASAIIKAVND